MKGLLIVLFSILSVAVPSLEQVRGYFEQAETSKEATENLHSALRDYQGNDAVLLAYKGASYTLKARFVQTRADKKALVTEGIQILEKAVNAAPKKVEIRLVRFAVQEHSPKILKYKGDMAEDKQQILANFESQPAALKSIIRRYVQQSTAFSATEKKKIGL